MVDLLIAYTVLSVVAFAAHALDKRAAIHDRRRIPERTLHSLELLGGWPGALLAMHFLRHKTRKASYFVVTWAIVVIHVAAWMTLLFKPELIR
jgi:uncharacterized membrane protein YsdA (DUF1294 family)